MKKTLLTITAVATQLVAMAQWTLFPGAAQDISCGSATKFAVVGSNTIYYYNFTTSAYVQLTGAAQFNEVGYAADGTLIARNGTNWNAGSNLLRFNNNPPLYNAYTVINGVVDNNITVRASNFAIASVGSGTNTGANNNIYKWNGTAWSTLAGSGSVSAKKVVGGGGFNYDIYAMNWSATGNNVMAYTSTGTNQGSWAMIANSTLNVSDISVGDAAKVLAISGGQLYYRWNGAWVLDNTTPTGITFTKVSAASDGTIMLLTSTGTIYRNTWSNVNCGLNVSVPINTTAPANLGILCAGQSTTLTATGNGVLNWTGAGGTGTGSTFVTPTLTSTTTFTVNNTETGCVSGPSVVTVSVTPAPSFNGTLTSICTGNSATLTATGTQTISWYASPSSTTALATGTVFTTPTLTSNTQYYISTTANGCETSRTVKTITVTPTQAAPMVDLPNSNLSICSGGLGTINMNNSYVFYPVPNGGTYLGTGSQYITPSLTVNTTYYAESYGNCLSPRTAITVTVNTVPAVVSQTVQNANCNGATNGSIALTLNNASSYTYSWSPNVSSTYSATGLAANVYTVDIANEGCINTQTYNVTQPAYYSVPVNVLGSGTILAYGANVTGSPTYQWVDCNNSNAPIAGATNSIFTPTVTGSYALTFGYGTCVSTSTCNTISVVTGINESALLNAITLQPNPAATQFTLNNVVVGSMLTVMDVTGKVVLAKTVNDVNETIETTNLANGIYVIQLQNNGAVAHKKLIISK